MPDQTVEQQARAMGWRPKEQFKGAESEFVDAETFLKKGKEVLPLVKAENRKLQAKLDAQTTQLNEQAALLAANQEAIDELKQYNSETNRTQMKAMKGQLKTAIAAAKKAGNHESEVELTEQLGEVNATLREAERTPEEKPTAKGTRTPSNTPVKLDPEIVQWQEDNPWYGTDERRTRLALSIGEELKSKGMQPGLALLNKVAEEVEATMPTKTGTSKVEGATPSGGGGGDEKGKTYADLPPDAKAACERFASKVVGEGRAHKTKEEWRKKYAQDFFREEQQS